MNKKKKILAMLAALAFTCGAQAQIEFDDSDMNGLKGPGAGSGSAEVWGSYDIDANIPPYAPVGSGILLLAGMAGSYALLSRRKDDNDK